MNEDMNDSKILEALIRLGFKRRLDRVEDKLELVESMAIPDRYGDIVCLQDVIENRKKEHDAEF
jgi:hypothetical protein